MSYRPALSVLTLALLPGVVAASGATAQTREVRLAEIERIGPPAVEFARISDVAADGSGGVWVADGMAGELYLRKGGDLRRIAGPGEGPGELRPGATELVVLPGDTVLAVEPHARRWSVFGPSGQFVETVVLDGLNALARGWRLGADGHVLARVHEQTALMPGAPPPTTGDPIVAFDRRGRRIRTLATLPISETFRMGPNGVPAITLLAAEPVWDADRSGRVITANTARYRVEVHGPDGTRTLVEREVEGRVIDDDVEARARELLRETLAGRRMPPPVMDQLVSTAALSPRMPVLGAVMAGPDGTVWIQDPAASADELVDLELPGGRTWRIHDREGRLVGTATVPEGFRAMQVEGRTLAGIAFDALGQTAAVVLRVEE